jgi:hypothetical protein
MELTVTGGLFLLLVGLAITRERRIIALLAFFTGFSAFAIVNIPAATFGVQPYHILGGIAICMALKTLLLSTYPRPRIGLAQLLLGIFVCSVRYFLHAAACLSDANFRTHFIANYSTNFWCVCSGQYLCSVARQRVPDERNQMVSSRWPLFCDVGVTAVGVRDIPYGISFVALQ